jgi:hypothetical protein
MKYPRPLYSAPPLVMTDDAGEHVWQAHLSREDDGTWVGWSQHGEDAAQQSQIARHLDVWEVVEAINERMDGRAYRGYVSMDDHVAWISDELVVALASQGIHIPGPPEVGPSLSPLSELGSPGIIGQSDSSPDLSR